MAEIKTFNDLQVWQKAHQFTLRVYHVTKIFPNEERYGIVSQLRRASYSVPANIVEGFRRRSLKDSIRFYTIADASLEEVKYFLLLSKDLKYLTVKNYDELQNNAEEVGKLLTGWIKSQRSYIT